MPEPDFTNREIVEMFGNMEKDILVIKEQTIKTNGSVASINRWRERMNGALSASGVFMMVVIVPILAWSIYTLTHINETVHNAVDDALSAYDIIKTK